MVSNRFLGGKLESLQLVLLATEQNRVSWLHLVGQKNKLAPGLHGDSFARFGGYWGQLENNGDAIKQLFLSE